MHSHYSCVTADLKNRLARAMNLVRTNRESFLVELVSSSGCNCIQEVVCLCQFGDFRLELVVFSHETLDFAFKRCLIKSRSASLQSFSSISLIVVINLITLISVDPFPLPSAA